MTEENLRKLIELEHQAAKLNVELLSLRMSLHAKPADDRDLTQARAGLRSGAEALRGLLERYRAPLVRSLRYG